jgi:hypothetical protein
VRAGGTQASSSSNLARQIGSHGVPLDRLPHRGGRRHAGGRRPHALRVSYSSDIGDLT